MGESAFKKRVHSQIKKRLPGCVILRNDSASQPGMLDDTILYGGRWGSLEYKDSAKAEKQPNQEFFVNKLNKMGFASFIYPENEEEVLDALEQTLKASG